MVLVIERESFWINVRHIEHYCSCKSYRVAYKQLQKNICFSWWAVCWRPGWAVVKKHVLTEDKRFRPTCFCFCTKADCAILSFSLFLILFDPEQRGEQVVHVWVVFRWDHTYLNGNYSLDRSLKSHLPSTHCKCAYSTYQMSDLWFGLWKYTADSRLLLCIASLGEMAQSFNCSVKAFWNCWEDKPWSCKGGEMSFVA